MGRKPKEELEEKEVKIEKKSGKLDYKDVFKELDVMNPDGALLSEDTLSVVDEWIDTGSYALNAICSGSMYKGIPSGRITGLIGPSGCGKTVMVNKIIANFLRKDPSRFAVIWDSENAIDKKMAESLGIDTKRVKYYPIISTLQCRNQISKLLERIIESGNAGKFMVAIDSLGNLAGHKELQDVSEDKESSDMGTRAKEIKTLLRTLTYKVAKSKTPTIFTNHIYNDPSARYPSLLKDQSGGEGPVYLASLLLQLGFRREKNEGDFTDEQLVAIAKKVGGISMTAITGKNRFIPQMLETEIYNNFKTGVDKYSGLFTIAKAFNVIEGDKTYTFEGTKLGYRKEFEKNPEVWEMIMPKLEIVLNKELSYSTDTTIDVLKQEVDELKEKETNELPE